MTPPGVGVVLVGLGGLVGSIARYGLSLLAQGLAFEWPAGTLAANVLGCFAIGVIGEMAARGQAVSPEARLLLATGFCGGFTTMSSLIYETVAMLRDSEYLHATGYLTLTIAASMVAFLAGVVTIRLLTRTGAGLWN